MASLTLQDYINQTSQVVEPTPRIVHSAGGDYLSVVFANDEFFVESIDEIDVHVAVSNRDIVGFTVLGFSPIAKKMLRRFQDESFTIRDLLLSVERLCPKCHRLHAVKESEYSALFQQLSNKGFRLPREVFSNAAG
jgi:hypothetical protein